MVNDAFLIRLVRNFDEVAGFFDVGFGGEGEFEIAGAEVADGGDVAGGGNGE